MACVLLQKLCLHEQTFDSYKGDWKMRKLLVSIASSLAMAVVFAGPANAAVIGSFDLVGGTFEYQAGGGLTDPNLPDEYVLIANGTYENLNLPDDRNAQRNYILTAHLESTIAQDPTPTGEVKDITLDLAQLAGGPVSFNQLLSTVDQFADLKFSGDPNNPGDSGTFTFGLETDIGDFIASGDSGNGELISGHAELRADLAQAVPGPGAMMLFGLGLLVIGAGFFTRRQYPLA